MLIKLSYPVTLDSYVRTVSLPSSCPSAGTNCLISGWGNTLSSGSQCQGVFYVKRRLVYNGFSFLLDFLLLFGIV